MAVLCDDIITFIVASGNGVVIAADTDIFRDVLPDTPNNAVGVFEYPGVTDEHSFVGNRSISIQIRRTSAEAARVAAWTIFDLLDVPRAREIWLTATRFSIMKARSTPAVLRQDDTGRTIYVFNVSVITSRDE